MFNKIKDFQLLLLGVFLSAGLIFSAIAISSNLSQSGITVTGSAFEIVKSDNATLRLELSANNESKAKAYEQIKSQVPTVKQYLLDKGILETEIKILPPTNYASYKTNPSNGYQTSQIASYNFSQIISVNSNDVDKIEALAIDAQSLLDKGLNINTNTPEYNYSKLADLKVKLLGEATKDAKARAATMLKATHNKVGKIKSVKMGVIQITPPTSNDVSDWGVNDTSTKDKKVTAVANVIFMVK